MTPNPALQRTARTMPKIPFSVGVTLLAAIPVVAAVAILRNPSPQRALSEACWSGDLLRARVALLCGANINRHGGGSFPNVVAAGWRGDVQMIEFCLSRGVNIETADKFGGTALSRAAQNGHDAAVEYLLAHGANPNVKDKEGGNTPLDLAEMNHDDRVIAALKSSGGQTNTK